MVIRRIASDANQSDNTDTSRVEDDTQRLVIMSWLFISMTLDFYLNWCQCWCTRSIGQLVKKYLTTLAMNPPFALVLILGKWRTKKHIAKWRSSKGNVERPAKCAWKIPPSHIYAEGEMWCFAGRTTFCQWKCIKSFCSATSKHILDTSNGQSRTKSIGCPTISNNSVIPMSWLLQKSRGGEILALKSNLIINWRYQLMSSVWY